MTPPRPLLLALLALGLVGAMPSGVRYAEDRAPAVVNPLFSTTMAEARLDELVFEGLYTDDPELRSVPDLALRHELATDRSSLTVTLRPGVSWHDGAPFTAADVVFTVDAMRNPTTASPEAGRVAFISRAEAVDPMTVRFTFVAPELAPWDRLHFKILPAHAFGNNPAVPRNHPFRTQPIGTGPYKVESFQEDGSIRLVRFPGHRAGGAIGEFTMREIADKAYQAKLLLYESVEALVRVLPRDLATLQGDGKVELYPYQTNSWWYLGMDLGASRFANPKVREAITHLVDADALLAPIGTGERVTGPYVPSSPYYDHDVPAEAHDPERAAALLREAGLVFDGRVWTQGGKPVRLRLATQAQVEVAQDVVINLQSQFAQAGIAVDPEFLGPTEWKRRIWTEGDYDLVLSQWSFDRNEDIYEQFHSKGTRNFSHYANAEVDKLLDAARVATDPLVKKAQLRRVHARIAADHPMVFLWTLDSYAAVSRHIGGVDIHPFYFFTWATSWTLR